MINNIPTYRAKMINSDEYVVGNYIKTQNKYYIYEDGTSDIYLDDEECFDDGSIDGEIRIIDLIFEIDATTLSIHFPDMLDSQGNKIFASLQEDGKGGDILFDMEYEFTLIFDDLKFKLEGLYSNTEINEYDKFTNFDSIGIQE